MTVTYTQQVATEKIGGFFRLLFRWRGSIYSVLYGEMTVFLFLYSLMSIVYRHVLSQNAKRDFEKLCIYFEHFADYIPVTFVVGFYVSRIIARRWTQWENIPITDRFAFNVSSYLQGVDLKARMLRRTLARYVNLATVLCFCDICIPVKKRFPSLDHLIVAGLMTSQEKELYLNTINSKDSNWWIPFHWAYTLLFRAKQEGKLPEGLSRLQDVINLVEKICIRVFASVEQTTFKDILDLRNKCWVLFSHDWIPIPMVYTQVATLAVYLFAFACILGRQYLDPEQKYSNHSIDLYVPFFTIFQLTFYLGWLKVAEVLISPMGMDADDFEINYIIERNLKMSYSLVDYNYNKLPPLEKDVHWDEEEPQMPHTVASAGIKDQPFIGSAANMPVKEKDARLTEAPASETGVPPSTPLSRQVSSRATSRPPSAVWRSLTRLVSRAGQSDMMNSSTAEIPLLGSPKLKRQQTIKEDDSSDLGLPLMERQKSSTVSRSKEALLPRLANITEHSDELLVDLGSPGEYSPPGFEARKKSTFPSVEEKEEPPGEEEKEHLFTVPPAKPDERKSPPVAFAPDRTSKNMEEQTTKELPS